MFSFLRVTLAMLAVLLLTACGSAPTVSDSKVMDPAATRFSQVQFVYRKGEMRVVSSTSSGRGGVTVGNTGFDDFGRYLVEEAPQALAAHQLKVASATLHEGRGPIVASAGEAGAPPPHLLIVGPEHAKVSATSAATKMNYVFAAALIDQQNRRLVWRAKIDTSTWVGTDFVTRNFDGQKFDAAYARELLGAIVRQMKHDGLI